VAQPAANNPASTIIPSKNFKKIFMGLSFGLSPCFTLPDHPYHNPGAANQDGVEKEITGSDGNIFV
jgi:hypothetical protein